MNKALQTYLQERHHIDAARIVPLAHGRFNQNFRIDGTRDSWFVKVYARFFEAPRIGATLEIQRLAAGLGTATPTPRPGAGDRLFEPTPLGLVAVWPWIWGHPIPPDAFCETAGLAAGRLLGSLHTALETIEQKASLQSVISSDRHAQPVDVGQRIEGLLAALPDDAKSDFVRFARRDLKHRLASLTGPPRDAPPLKTLANAPQHLIHADFGWENLIYEQAAKAWIVDFDFCRFGAPAVDLMRLLIPLLAESGNRGGARLIGSVVAGYRERRSVAQADLDIYPWTYWYDLISNPFPITLLSSAGTKEIDPRWIAVAKRRYALYTWLESHATAVSRRLKA